MSSPRPLLVVALALALAACGATEPSSGATTVPAGPAQSTAPATDGPATEEPIETEPIEPEPIETDPIETDPIDTIEPSASLDASDGPAAACSGSEGNREFYAGLAAAVDWTVLCAVLPKGWSVSTGSYRLANGGKLEIGYKGPGGATLSLSEGAFCADGSGCVPAGTDGGEVPLGPMTGTLIRQDDGGFSIVVDRGLNPSWLLEMQGQDESATLAIGAALAVVAPQE